MTDPIRVWLIEDMPSDAMMAWNVLTSIEKEEQIRMEKLWAATFDFPPHLRRAIDVSEEPVKRIEHADIVILDLCLGLTLAADSFYESLRAWEVHEPEAQRPAWILLWSAYEGVKKVRAFSSAVRPRDLRTVETSSKREELLKPKLLNLFRAVLQEQAE